MHINCIETARGKLLDPASTSSLSSLFKVFADPTRIRLLSALSASELCVCDLGALLGMSQSAVSHQLALLRAARVVRSRREGKVVWYALDDDHVATLLAMGLEHLGEAGRQS
ncbi:MAG TPA: metalloregulator ArsR/SmtB family transcription factor [Rectinemataceae bacterium]|nr:metalloregulator ArsR/SmtB family transcription factor [Rectinemataceae bacterium]